MGCLGIAILAGLAWVLLGQLGAWIFDRTSPYYTGREDYRNGAILGPIYLWLAIEGWRRR